MRNVLSIILGWMFSTLAIAGTTIDTINVNQDTIVEYDTIVHQYPDTFKVKDMRTTTDVDLLLLHLVSEQGKALHQRDSLMLSDGNSTLSDSIDRMLLSQEAERLKLASDSSWVHTVMNIPVEKAWVRDAEEERIARIRALRKPSPWKKEAKILVQLTQNFTSKNWYQGGSSSFAAYMHANGYITYQSGKMTWENTGEWLIGGSTISGDSIHKVNTTEDKLRLMTKFNYQAHKTLYYSVAGEFETRLLPTYKENSHQMKTGPFSPLRLNLALGLDYQPIKGLSIAFSPLAYKLVYVADTVNTQQTEFGIEHGKNILNDVGSSLRVEYNWHPVREVDLQSKLYLYTNYRRVEIDLEVTCDFIINRFLSARIILHPRYDNAVIYEKGEVAKLQFKELLSIGFAHKFR